jgi:hypothetical protein
MRIAAPQAIATAPAITRGQPSTVGAIHPLPSASISSRARRNDAIAQQNQDHRS